MQCGKVKGRTLSSDSSIIGAHNDTHVLSDMTHDVEFEDSDVREHINNMISENMLTRTDNDGHTTMALENMLNHRKDDAS